MNQFSTLVLTAICATLICETGYSGENGVKRKPNMVFGSITAKERLLRKQNGPSKEELAREKKQRELDKKLAAEVKRLEFQQKRDALLRQKQMIRQGDIITQSDFREDGYMSIPWGASIAAVSSVYTIRENILETILMTDLRIRVFIEESPASPIRGRVFYFIQENGISRLFRVDVAGIRESNEKCLAFVDGHKKLYGSFSSIDSLKNGLSYTKFKRDAIADTDVNIFKINGKKSSLTVIYDNPQLSRTVVECLEKLQKTKESSAIAADGSVPKNYNTKIIWYRKDFNTGVEKLRNRLLEIIGD